jgi:hypothetical protein
MINNSMGMKWWNTTRSHRLYKTIAKMAIQLDSQFAEDDVDAFVHIVQHTVQSSAGNPQLFHLEKVLIHPAEHLFEARAIAAVPEFARSLWELISVRLQQAIRRWLTVYPLPKVAVIPWQLGYDGIALVDFSQAATWATIAADFGRARDWNPILGTGLPEKHDLSFFYGLPHPPAQWLVCESQGTSARARLDAEQKMRRFLAVLFSHVHSGMHSILQTSLVPAPSVAVQFPESSLQQQISAESLNIVILLPPLLNQVRLNTRILPDVWKWYDNFYTQQGEKTERANKGALFINYAMATSGLERFIMFFVGLDALHGQRGKVEASIKAGVQQTFPNDPSALKKQHNSLIFAQTSSMVALLASKNGGGWSTTCGISSVNLKTILHPCQWPV